jgi:hypothetical protein
MQRIRPPCSKILGVRPRLRTMCGNRSLTKARSGEGLTAPPLVLLRVGQLIQ